MTIRSSHSSNERCLIVKTIRNVNISTAVEELFHQSRITPHGSLANGSGPKNSLNERCLIVKSTRNVNISMAVEELFHQACTPPHCSLANCSGPKNIRHIARTAKDQCRHHAHAKVPSNSSASITVRQLRTNSFAIQLIHNSAATHLPLIFNTVATHLLIMFDSSPIHLPPR